MQGICKIEMPNAFIFQTLLCLRAQNIKVLRIMRNTQLGYTNSTADSVAIPVNPPARAHSYNFKITYMLNSLEWIGVWCFHHYVWVKVSAQCLNWMESAVENNSLLEWSYCVFSVIYHFICCKFLFIFALTAYFRACFCVFVMIKKNKGCNVKKHNSFSSVLFRRSVYLPQSTVTPLPLISHSVSYDPFSLPRLKASFTLSCLIFCPVLAVCSFLY